MFAGLYALTLCTVFALYRIGSKEAVIPHYVMILLLLSKRIHSIFVLRMFNDCVAVACGYIAILLFTKYQVKAYKNRSA